MVAGAETVVMSLWKVNDDTTRQLMEAYYRPDANDPSRVMSRGRSRGARASRRSAASSTSPSGSEVIRSREA
uniref:CHAT domain-containing protein n=1 Tax=Pyxidicoccus xibeiensis TaxID=2906759 RepID=UPI002B1F3CE0|nr:CHAT domain-containing protein [Pyxidicoccus xibeiensis]